MDVLAGQQRLYRDVLWTHCLSQVKHSNIVASLRIVAPVVSYSCLTVSCGGHAVQAFCCVLSCEQHAAIAGESDGRMRRRQLARVFARSSMSAVFDDPETPLAALETRAVRARITAERRAARLDPIGPSPILECVMRLRAERADLRRINWGIAQGMPTEAIVGQLVVAT